MGAPAVSSTVGTVCRVVVHDDIAITVMRMSRRRSMM